jgi:TetR/AcrR family transcriptional repressor of lmrAB and yxaGH operons
MASPPRTDTPVTRDRVIAATIELMRRRGYAGIGINEILAEGGAPKGSLYHFFPDGKRQIASEAMAVYGSQALALYEKALAAPGTPAQKVKRLLKVPASRLIESEFRSSCMAGTLCLDLDDSLEGVRGEVGAFFEQMIELVASSLRIQDRRRARSFAGLLLTTIEGAYVRGRAERTTQAFDEAASLLGEMADSLAAN